MASTCTGAREGSWGGLSGRRLDWLMTGSARSAKLPPLERPAPLPLSRDDSLGDQTPAGDDHHIPLTIQGSLERPPDVALADRALPVMSQSSL